VPHLVALASRPFSFPEPSAELVPFIIGVAEAIGLLASGAFHRLLVGKRVADCWLAVLSVAIPSTSGGDNGSVFVSVGSYQNCQPPISLLDAGQRF